MQLLAVHLSAHSDYSLLGSVCRVESLVKQAAKLGIEALALTDHNTTAGHGELERYCRLAGITPIFGLELDLAYQKRTSPVIVLALSDAGYSNLLQLASLPGPVGRGDFLVHKDGLALLAGGPRGELMRLVAEGELDQAKGLHAWYEREFGSNYYIHHELGQELDIFALFPEEKFVMCQDVRYLEAPSLLTLEVLGKIKGGEGSLPPHPLLSWPELCKAFQGPDKVVQQTLALAKRCNAKLPRERTLPPHPSGASLPDVTWQKAKERFGHLTEEVVDRLNQELSIIKDLGYEDYFLIVADIVRFAKDAKIAVGPGRGSSASSLVAYVLGITEVDPLSWGLLFERFLNAERRTRPDIDLDFCYERRGEVLSYVLERFGQEHVAQIGTYGTFGPKAAAQEVRRILGQDNPAVERDLQGLKRHRSTHAAGVIITARPTQAISAVYLDREIPVTHLDMYALEELGVLKIDLLALRTLTLLQRMEERVAQRDQSFSLKEIPLNDSATFALLAQGKSLGIFQLESELFQELMRKLKPRSFGDLVALLALGRPGPLNMFPEFVSRRENPGQVQYLHPALEDILGETYGLILYQEQVMLIANRLGGLSLGEADLLRSALGKNDPEAVRVWRGRFVEGATSKSGLSSSVAKRLFAMIAEFSGYAFNKAHSVSYAFLSWQAAYIKTHYPGEFFETLLNQGCTPKVRSAYLYDAQGLGVKVLAPSVIQSGTRTSLEGRDLRLGLAIPGLNLPPLGVRRITEGDRNWSDLAQFRRAVPLEKEPLERLVLCGALDDLGERNRHLQELGLEPKRQLELLNAERELLGVYASQHPCSPFLPLVENLKGGDHAVAGEICQVKAIGKMWQGVLDTPGGLSAFEAAADSFAGIKPVPKMRIALFGKSSPDGVFRVRWALPLGPTLLITPDPHNLQAIKAVLEDEAGAKPTILLFGDAYHLLPQQFWAANAVRINERFKAERIVYTWLDPWKENVP